MVPAALRPLGPTEMWPSNPPDRHGSSGAEHVDVDRIAGADRRVHRDRRDARLALEAIRVGDELTGGDAASEVGVTPLTCQALSPKRNEVKAKTCPPPFRSKPGESKPPLTAR